MFYVFDHTPDVNDTAESPYVLTMDLTAGVIHQVDVLFQEGCNHETFARIFRGGFQVWPTNREKSFRGNATVISFREFHNLTPGDNTLQAHIWSTLGSNWKEVVIQIGLLPKAIIQPMSFEELVRAAAGIE